MGSLTLAEFLGTKPKKTPIAYLNLKIEIQRHTTLNRFVASLGYDYNLFVLKLKGIKDFTLTECQEIKKKISEISKEQYSFEYLFKKF